MLRCCPVKTFIFVAAALVFFCRYYSAFSGRICRFCSARIAFAGIYARRTVPQITGSASFLLPEVTISPLTTPPPCILKYSTNSLQKSRGILHEKVFFSTFFGEILQEKENYSEERTQRAGYLSVAPRLAFASWNCNSQAVSRAGVTVFIVAVVARFSFQDIN